MQWKTTKAAMIVVALICSVTLLLLLPALDQRRGGYPTRADCKINLKQIGLSLHNYHEAWGAFPPAYIADENGRPMHSWRVLLLPFLEQQDLYDQYDFNEPWDSPHNSQLAEQGSRFYGCLTRKRATGSSDVTTDYVAIVGPGAAFEEDVSRPIADFKDGPGDTVMVVELGASDIHWMEPRDVEVRNVLPKPAAEHHGDGTHILFVDGRVRFLPSDIDPELLRALITIDGGEEIPEDW